MKLLKPYFLALLYILFASIAQAQNTSLYTFYLTDSITGHSAFRAVKVIDNRKHKKDLGYIHTVTPTHMATFYKKKALVTAKPLSAELSHLAERALVHAALGEDTLLLVLHEFYTRMDDEERAVFYIRAVCFLGRDGLYRFIRELDVLDIETKGEVLHNILWKPNAIVLDFFKAIAEISTAPPGNTYYTEQSAARYYRTLTDTLPVYNARRYKQGVYLTLQDFLYERPADTGFAAVDHFADNMNRPYFYYKNEKGKKGEKVVHAFAVYDGKNWYQPSDKGGIRLNFVEGNVCKQLAPGALYYRLHPLTGEFLPALRAQ